MSSAKGYPVTGKSEAIGKAKREDWVELIGGDVLRDAFTLVRNIAGTFGIGINGLAAVSMNVAGAPGKIERELWLSVEDNTNFQWNAEVAMFSSNEISPSEEESGAYLPKSDSGVTSDGIARVA